MSAAFVICQPGKQESGGQVCAENQQGQHKNFIEFIDILKLLDFGCQNHGAGAGDKDQGADGNHGIDEIVAEYLQKAGKGIGGHDPEDGFRPAVAHEPGSGFPACVHFGERIFHHQVRRGKVVHNIAQYHQEQRILQRRTGK